MTSPSEPRSGEPDEPVNLAKNAPEPQAPFDPYRFGLPENPPPPEYAPPGWTPPSPPPPSPAAGYPPSPSPYAGGPGQPGQQTPYPPYPYGSAPYGAGYQPAAQRGSNGKAVTALVLGILTVLMFWTSVFDALLAIPAVVFGIVALTEANRRGVGKGMAIAGLVCGAVGAVLAIVWTAFIVHVANQCGGIDQSNQPGFQQCLRNHL